jgi:hypothetical protein
MPTSWKGSRLGCKITIVFNTHKCRSQHIYAFAKIGELHKAYCLAIVEISMSCSYPLLNAFCIWEIMQSVNLLNKHVHNKWQMGRSMS